MRVLFGSEHTMHDLLDRAPCNSTGAHQGTEARETSATRPRVTADPNDERLPHCLGNGEERKTPQSEAVENVSQSFGRPESMPRLNQRTRCSELPCVNESGTTWP